MTQIEFKLLRTLMERAGHVVRRNDLMDRVWGIDWVGDTHTLDVHIRWLRQKVEALFISGVLTEIPAAENAGETIAAWAPSRLQDRAASLEGKVKRRLLVVDARGYVLADSAGELDRRIASG